MPPIRGASRQLGHQPAIRCLIPRRNRQLSAARYPLRPDRVVRRHTGGMGVLLYNRSWKRVRAEFERLVLQEESRLWVPG